MKVVRSILAIVIGTVVSGMVISGTEFINFQVYRPDDGRTMDEIVKDMKSNPEATRAWIESLPVTAMVVVLVGWQLGAFLGGAVSAAVAGWGRLVHAGTIGALVLAGTVLNAINMKAELGFVHPDWMILAGLLLPIPISLLAGQLVSLLCPCGPAQPEAQS